MPRLHLSARVAQASWAPSSLSGGHRDPLIFQAWERPLGRSPGGGRKELRYEFHSPNTCWGLLTLLRRREAAGSACPQGSPAGPAGATESPPAAGRGTKIKRGEKKASGDSERARSTAPPHGRPQGRERRLTARPPGQRLPSLVTPLEAQRPQPLRRHPPPPLPR